MARGAGAAPAGPKPARRAAATAAAPTAATAPAPAPVAARAPFFARRLIFKHGLPPSKRTVVTKVSPGALAVFAAAVAALQEQKQKQKQTKGQQQQQQLLLPHKAARLPLDMLSAAAAASDNDASKLLDPDVKGQSLTMTPDLGDAMHDKVLRYLDSLLRSSALQVSVALVGPPPPRSSAAAAASVAATTPTTPTPIFPVKLQRQARSDVVEYSLAVGEMLVAAGAQSGDVIVFEVLAQQEQQQQQLQPQQPPSSSSSPLPPPPPPLSSSSLGIAMHVLRPCSASPAAAVVRSPPSAKACEAPPPRRSSPRPAAVAAAARASPPPAAAAPAQAAAAAPPAAAAAATARAAAATAAPPPPLSAACKRHASVRQAQAAASATCRARGWALLKAREVGISLDPSRHGSLKVCAALNDGGRQGGMPTSWRPHQHALVATVLARSAPRGAVGGLMAKLLASRDGGVAAAARAIAGAPRAVIEHAMALAARRGSEGGGGEGGGNGGGGCVGRGGEGEGWLGTWAGMDDLGYKAMVAVHKAVYDAGRMTLSLLVEPPVAEQQQNDSQQQEQQQQQQQQQQHSPATAAAASAGGSSSGGGGSRSGSGWRCVTAAVSATFKLANEYPMYELFLADAVEAAGGRVGDVLALELVPASALPAEAAAAAAAAAGGGAAAGASSSAASLADASAPVLLLRVLPVSGGRSAEHGKKRLPEAAAADVRQKRLRKAPAPALQPAAASPPSARPAASARRSARPVLPPSQAASAAAGASCAAAEGAGAGAGAPTHATVAARAAAAAAAAAVTAAAAAPSAPNARPAGAAPTLPPPAVHISAAYAQRLEKERLRCQLDEEERVADYSCSLDLVSERGVVCLFVCLFACVRPPRPLPPLPSRDDSHNGHCCPPPFIPINHPNNNNKTTEPRAVGRAPGDLAAARRRDGGGGGGRGGGGNSSSTTPRRCASAAAAPGPPRDRRAAGPGHRAPLPAPDGGAAAELGALARAVPGCRHARDARQAGGAARPQQRGRGRRPRAAWVARARAGAGGAAGQG
jgi:trimeric autotransporter adhesin